MKADPDCEWCGGDGVTCDCIMYDAPEMCEGLFDCPCTQAKPEPPAQYIGKATLGRTEPPMGEW